MLCHLCAQIINESNHTGVNLLISFMNDFLLKVKYSHWPSTRNERNIIDITYYHWMGFFAHLLHAIWMCDRKTKWWLKNNVEIILDESYYEKIIHLGQTSASVVKGHNATPRRKILSIYMWIRTLDCPDSTPELGRTSRQSEYKQTFSHMMWTSVFAINTEL